MKVNDFKKVLRYQQIRKISEVKKLISLSKKYGLSIATVGIDGQYRNMKEAKTEIGESFTLSNYIIVQQSDTILNITTKWLDGKGCTYQFSLTGEDIEHKKGQAAFMEMSRYYKLPRIMEDKRFSQYIASDGRFQPSAKAVLGYNEIYDNNEYKKCYEYDLNSAYASVMLKGIPDLYNPSELKYGGIKVKKGEVGFLLDDEMTLVEDGGIADIKFPVIKCPEELKTFIMKYYNIKREMKEKIKNAKTKAEREKYEKERQNAKDMLNIPIGYTQRYNPFFRAYIIHKCNEVIENLIDENTLLWNTDAIFTLNRRDDLDIGEDIGQFKVVEIDTLRYRGNTYQINDDIPAYRGLPKEWFRKWEQENGRKYNLMVDGIPVRKNSYKVNMKTLEVTKND